MAILLDSQQVERYQLWERTFKSELPGRYAVGFQGAPVFALRDEDVPSAKDQLECQDRNGQAILNALGQSLPPAFIFPGVSCSDIRQILSALNGQTRFKDVCAQLAALGSPVHLAKLCQGLLGHAVFLPEAVDELEQAIRRVEIVRFPMQSPYQVLREYWSNCRDVRAAIATLFDHLHTQSAFKSALADLHILATMGSDLRTYYGGSGGVPTVPGGYRTHPVRTGLAVNKASFIDAYLEGIGLHKFRRDEYYVVSGEGMLLGCVAGNGLIFRHPPPDNGYLERILEAMRVALVELAGMIEQGCREETLLPLSRFHKLFLHAHPFYNINNSIAMNIVNYCLKKAGYGVIPHLLLDFIALRIEFVDYAQVFEKAVENYAFTATASQDDAQVLARISRCYEQLLSRG